MRDGLENSNIIFAGERFLDRRAEHLIEQLIDNNLTLTQIEKHLIDNLPETWVLLTCAWMANKYRAVEFSNPEIALVLRGIDTEKLPESIYYE